VLAYHLWPSRFPGGYIGVDVFFVISGFLITAHLLKEAESTGRIDLVRFWGRRALRLLPLAAAVLVATSVAIAVWAPPSTWRPALEGVLASTFYIQNWTLAVDTVDYLARDQAPLPTQHYWSLSVEEQFYLLWPVLLLAAMWLASRARSGRFNARRSWILFIAVVAVASFLYSLWLTEADPATAYFSTFTRIWQFAAGAALVFVPGLAARIASRGRTILAATSSWAGLALIILGTLLLPAGTPFPGVAALVPVIGAMLLIWSGTVPVPYTPSTFGSIRPLERIGDLSYGIYLWHWPLIVLAPAALGRPLTTLDKVIILVVTIALAEISKRAIEDPFRYASRWHRRPITRFIPGAVGMSATVVVVVAVAATLGLGPFRAADSPISAPAVGESEPGAMVANLRPSIPDRGVDYAVMYDCFDFDRSGPRECRYGEPGSPTQIAVIGDSHAAHWIPGLASVVESRGWGLTTYVGMNCDALLAEACAGGEEMLEGVAEGGYDLVLVGTFRGSSTPEPGLEESLSALTASGIPLALLVDVPAHPGAAFDCLDEGFRTPALPVECTTPRGDGLTDVPDRAVPIAGRLGMPLIDLTDRFCDAELCRSVLDDSIVVYQDSPSSHLTTTASRLLAPELDAALARMLP